MKKELEFSSHARTTAHQSPYVLTQHILLVSFNIKILINIYILRDIKVKTTYFYAIK